MSNADLVQRAQAVLFQNYRTQPIALMRGEGTYVWDADGKRYLDFVQGWAVNCLGHSPPAVADAVSRQAQQLITPSPAYFNNVAVELAAKLTRLSGLDQVFFTNCGAEANRSMIATSVRFKASADKSFPHLAHGTLCNSRSLRTRAHL